MVKITKALARKLYNEGEEIMIIPSRVRPDGILASWMCKPKDDNFTSFEQICNAVHYYNCNPETGMSLVYYAKSV